MKLRQKSRSLFEVINRIAAILPTFFWAFLIFGFEEPYMALISIGAALIHECGHILSLLWHKGRLNFRGVLSGFRIRSTGTLTYNEEIMTYASGPLINILFFVIFSFFAPIFGGITWDIAIINLVTALSNLLPIEGYDGYGIIRTYLEKRDKDYLAGRVLKRISSTLTFLFCLLSLYLIDRIGGGYWIFAIFFISTIKCIKDDLGE